MTGIVSSALTDQDRRTIASARELAVLTGEQIRGQYGQDAEISDSAPLARALGKAQFLLGELADLAERLSEGEQQ